MVKILTEHLKTLSQKSIIMIDGYEYLASEEQSMLINQFIVKFPQYVWVITSRINYPDELLNHNMNIYLFKFDVMSIASTFEILQKWGINDNAIKERIYKKSNGHPLYIERLVEAYYQAFRNNEAFDEMSFIDKYSF